MPKPQAGQPALDPLEAALRACLAAIANGERSGLAELYDRSAGKLFGVALRLLRRRDLAEETLHDVFLKIWDHAHLYRPERGPAMAWLVTMTRNAALDQLRRRRREVPLDDVPPMLDPAGGLPMAAPGFAADGWREQALRACLEQLDPEPRKCLLLAYHQGYTHEELARRLDRPLGTIKSWVRRSLIRLKQCLEATS